MIEYSDSLCALDNAFLLKELSSTNIWTLASLTLPKIPEPELRKDHSPLDEARFSYKLMHIKAT